MNFDEIIDRRNTHSSKWDSMEKIYGVSPDTGLAMWVADMDFRPPQGVSDALHKMADHGVYGYYGDDTAYRAAICWWSSTTPRNGRYSLSVSRPRPARKRPSTKRPWPGIGR